MSSLCKEQLSYSRSQSSSSWFCMRMDLSNLWPWSFTFYVCVESLFDRLIVRGQIESFRIKSSPKVFGYRCNFPVWEKPNSTLIQSCSGRAVGTGASYLFPLFCGISADPVGVVQGQAALSWHSLLESLGFACPAPLLPGRTGGGWLNPSAHLVSRRVHLCLPFSQESIFTVAVTLPAIS